MLSIKVSAKMYQTAEEMRDNHHSLQTSEMYCIVSDV